MNLSIFNSSGSVWVGGILGFVILLLLWEAYWRTEGYWPSVVDDVELWSLEYQSVLNDEKAVALLGSSRMQLDVDPVVFKQEFPNCNFYHLSINGGQAPPVLDLLANDQAFKGKVLVELTANSFYPSTWGRASEWVDLNGRVAPQQLVDRWLRRIIEEKFVTLLPELSMVEIVRGISNGAPLSEPKHVYFKGNRTGVADFSDTNVDRLHANFVTKGEAIFQQNKNEYSNWHVQVDAIKVALKKMERKGSEVLFLRFNDGGGFAELFSRYFPKAQYWDQIDTRMDVKTFHYLDYLDLHKFEPRDGLHLESKDTVAYTHMWSVILKKSGVLSDCY